MWIAVFSVIKCISRWGFKICNGVREYFPPPLSFLGASSCLVACILWVRRFSKQYMVFSDLQEHGMHLKTGHGYMAVFESKYIFQIFLYNYKYLLKSKSHTKALKSESPKFGTRCILLLETISNVLIRLSTFFRNSYHEVNLNDICGQVAIPSFLLEGRNTCSKWTVFICPFRKKNTGLCPSSGLTRLKNIAEGACRKSCLQPIHKLLWTLFCIKSVFHWITFRICSYDSKNVISYLFLDYVLV